MTRTAATHNRPLQIMVICDDKAGHQNQSLGLAQAIARRQNANITQADALPPATCLAGLLLGQIPAAWQTLKTPDIVISTGSGTHLSLLTAARLYPNSFTTLLCTSALPSGLFDLNAVPEHDNHRPGPNIVYTKGVLNKVIPSQESIPGYGLMLIGGESKHYRWDSRKIVAQIKQVCQQSPDIEWHLTNSRRTPENFNALLEREVSGIRFHRWQDTPGDWLPQQLAQAATIWVTPDSVSMVYESLTSGNQVYLFRLKSRKTRVAKGIEALRGHEAGTLQDDSITPPSNNAPLWEADRIANIIVDKLA